MNKQTEPKELDLSKYEGLDIEVEVDTIDIGGITTKRKGLFWKHRHPKCDWSVLCQLEEQETASGDKIAELLADAPKLLAEVQSLRAQRDELAAALGQVTESASDIKDMASAFIVSGDALSLENYAKNIQNIARAALAKAKGETP